MSHLARVAVLGQLSGAFAHELNQPLTAILNNAEAARQVIKRDPIDRDLVSQMLKDIVADDQRAVLVISRLRALLKRGERKLQAIDPKELIESVMELAQTELVTRHVVATAVVQPVPTVWGDRVQLQQVLLNLIVNACEAMESTAVPARRLKVSVSIEMSGGVHLEVRDSGAGIAPGMIDRLFEPFVTTKPHGLGLGLSISRTIVAAHGGHLWGENNRDCGATMHCFLPIAAPRPARPTTTESRLPVRPE